HRGVAARVAGRRGLSALRGHGVSFMPVVVDATTLGAGRGPRAPCSPQAHCQHPPQAQHRRQSLSARAGTAARVRQLPAIVKSGRVRVTPSHWSVKTLPRTRTGSANGRDWTPGTLLAWSHRPARHLRQSPVAAHARAVQPGEPARDRKERTAHHGSTQHAPPTPPRPAPPPPRPARSPPPRPPSRPRPPRPPPPAP